MATPLKIDASDLLGKLHIAALDKVNSKFKGAWNVIKKIAKGRIVKSSIENTAFDEKTGKLNIPPDGKAKIRVVAAGTGAKREAEEMFALYMKWFAGMEEDVSKFVKDAGTTDSGVSGKDLTIGGQGVFDLAIDYELIATEKAAAELKDFADKTNKSAQSSDSSDSGVINANESTKLASKKSRLCAGSHPFESILNKDKADKTMVKESDTEKFVKQVANKKNAKAQATLESIVKRKIEAKMKEVLQDFEKNS